MKVPYIINKNTISVYTPSPQTDKLIGEELRKLIAENVEWDKDHCPSLVEFCLQSIAKNFVSKPILEELPCADRVHLVDILPLDLPLEFIIPRIDDEHYWERRYKEVFKFSCRTKPRNWTWKSQYLEKHCQKLVEEAQPQYNDEESFDEILALCDPYVTRLYVEQLQTWKPPLTMEKEDIPEVWPSEHINMGPIFKKLNHLQEFGLVFGMNNVGEDFTWDMFKVSVQDCARIAKAIHDLHDLRIFKIHRSKLEFKHCQALIRELVKYSRLEELHLSHCQIGNAGALCVAYLLEQGTHLKVLNLTNNCIGKVGCEGLGFALLQGNCHSLQDLILRLNPLGTDGAMGIMRALVRCPIPKRLSMATCMFEDDTPIKVCQMIKLCGTLKKLDISSNWFGDEIGKELVESVAENTCIEWMDTRETNISEQQKEEINKYLVRNRKAAIMEAKISNMEQENINFCNIFFE